MIRLVLAAVCAGVFVGFLPAALGDRVFNGADLVVAVAVVLLVVCLWRTEWVGDSPANDPPSRLDELDRRG